MPARAEDSDRLPMAQKPILRMLYWTREEFMTFRVDVDVLFGRELLGRGHEIDFVMQAGSTAVNPGPHPWNGRTVFVGRAPGRGLIGRVSKHLLTFWHDLRMLVYASRDKYDAIQFRDKFFIAAIGILFARFRGQKFFYWLSFPFPEDDRLRAASKDTHFRFLVNLRGIVSAWMLYRWILPRANHAFVQSARMKQDIAAQGIGLAKMTPVPMGIDLGDIPLPRPAASPAAADAIVSLGYLGALNAARHIEMLVDMLVVLRQTHTPVRLLLIGDAYEREDRDALQRRADQAGVSNWLEITGFLPRATALQRMQETKIALSAYYPSPLLMSTSPTKLVEYLALGIPVVASAHPEQRAILAESRAGISAPWGARHFARSVRWMLSRSTGELASMGANGRAWVQENRTYLKIADDLELKYIELFNETSEGSVAGTAT
jgi:glycosyltransferase involved in cell wall biosynthesis